MPPSPPEKRSGYLPGLDGLRAIAILGVLLTHDLPWSVAGHSNVAWKGFGGWGVQLFFCISGVLICWRLLEEEARVGRIQLGSFYIRRLFRIQPAAFCYLAAVAILFFTGVILPNWNFWLAAALSYINFVVTENTPPGAAAFLGHFWTLAVEEHFYILLSLFLFLFRERRALLLSLAIAILLAAQSHGMDHGEFSPVVSPRRTYWIIQFLLLPALFAILARQPRVRSWIGSYLKPWVAVLATLAAMLGYLWSDSPRVFSAGWTAFSVPLFLIISRNYLFYGFGGIVLAVMLNPRSLSTRFLELAPLRFVGRLSYSIYLWHILFFIPVYLGDLVHSPVLNTLSARPWKYIATAATALLSYFFIEKPLIRIGHRIAPPAVQGRADLASSASAKPVAIASGLNLTRSPRDVLPHP